MSREIKPTHNSMHWPLLTILFQRFSGDESQKNSGATRSAAQLASQLRQMLRNMERDDDSIWGLNAMQLPRTQDNIYPPKKNSIKAAGNITHLAAMSVRAALSAPCSWRNFSVVSRPYDTRHRFPSTPGGFASRSPALCAAQGQPRVSNGDT